MKAIGFTQSLPIEHPESLIDIELAMPDAKGFDLLVKVKAIAVNPVDYKVRQLMPPQSGEYKVLGWDAVGEVVAMGENVTDFSLGDQVYYAGDLFRQGANAEFQAVDSRIVGHKPNNLRDAEAAALPLTTITAWELLFEKLKLTQQTPQSGVKTEDVLLVTGAAGGVGSILIQLAKQLTGATVIATASRPESRDWVLSLGADYTVNHYQPLQPQLDALGIDSVSHVASLNGTDKLFDQLTEVTRPFGHIALIDDPKNLDISKLKFKSLSLHWEFMFTRSHFETMDIEQQGILLNTVAELVDQGLVKTTTGKHLGKINADNLKAAHAELESGSAIGKLVLEGF